MSVRLNTLFGRRVVVALASRKEEAIKDAVDTSVKAAHQDTKGLLVLLSDQLTAGQSMVNDSLKVVRSDTTSLSEGVVKVTKMHSELAVHVQLGLKAMTETFTVNYKEMQRMNDGLQDMGQAAFDARSALMGTHREMLETHAVEQVRKMHREEVDLLRRERPLLTAE